MKSGVRQTRLLYSRERAPGIHGIGVWVSPRNSLDGLEKRINLLLLSGLELGTVQPVAYLLYRLRWRLIVPLS